MRITTMGVAAVALFAAAACKPIPASEPSPEHSAATRRRPSTAATLGIPPGHLPPPGMCRVWMPDQPPGQRPRLAIHPYPNQYTAPFRLSDGTELLVRPIGPEDEPLIVELHAGLSEHTIRMRFFSMVFTVR